MYDPGSPSADSSWDQSLVLVRCSTRASRGIGKGQCKNYVEFGSKFKLCESCRARMRAKDKNRSEESIKKRHEYSSLWRKSDHGKQVVNDWLQSESGKASIAKFKASDKGIAWRQRVIEASRSDHSKAVRAKYRASDAGKESHRRGIQKYVKTEKGKTTISNNHKAFHARTKEDPGLKMVARIGTSMSDMMSGRRGVSKKVRKATLLSAIALRQHFEHSFVDGMSWENHGNGKDDWNIGHRIAKAMFDANNEEDMKRCWNPRNLFAQWKTENSFLSVKLPCSELLLNIKSLWPVGWNDELPSDSKRMELERAARSGKAYDHKGLSL